MAMYATTSAPVSKDDLIAKGKQELAQAGKDAPQGPVNYSGGAAPPPSGGTSSVYQNKIAAPETKLSPLSSLGQEVKPAPTASKFLDPGQKGAMGPVDAKTTTYLSPKGQAPVQPTSADKYEMYKKEQAAAAPYQKPTVDVGPKEVAGTGGLPPLPPGTGNAPIAQAPTANVQHPTATPAAPPVAAPPVSVASQPQETKPEVKPAYAGPVDPKHTAYMPQTYTPPSDEANKKAMYEKQKQAAAEQQVKPTVDVGPKQVAGGLPPLPPGGQTETKPPQAPPQAPPAQRPYPETKPPVATAPPGMTPPGKPPVAAAPPSPPPAGDRPYPNSPPPGLPPLPPGPEQTTRERPFDMGEFDWQNGGGMKLSPNRNPNGQLDYTGPKADNSAWAPPPQSVIDAGTGGSQAFYGNNQTGGVTEAGGSRQLSAADMAAMQAKRDGSRQNNPMFQTQGGGGSGGNGDGGGGGGSGGITAEGLFNAATSGGGSGGGSNLMALDPNGNPPPSPGQVWNTVTNAWEAGPGAALPAGSPGSNTSPQGAVGDSLNDMISQIVNTMGSGLNSATNEMTQNDMDRIRQYFGNQMAGYQNVNDTAKDLMDPRHQQAAADAARAQLNASVNSERDAALRNQDARANRGGGMSAGSNTGIYNTAFNQMQAGERGLAQDEFGRKIAADQTGMQGQLASNAAMQNLLQSGFTSNKEMASMLLQALSGAAGPAAGAAKSMNPLYGMFGAGS